MTAAAIIVLGAATAWLLLHRALEDRDVHRAPHPRTHSSIALRVYVGQHTMARARLRISPHVSALDIAADVIAGIRAGRIDVEIPRRENGSIRSAKGGAEYVWNESFDRVYVVQRGERTISTITVLPVAETVPMPATPVVDAIRAALARYET